MTRTVYVIGIGAGDPEHLTLQAVAAMNRVDVFFTICLLYTSPSPRDS